jgi:TIR domain
MWATLPFDGSSPRERPRILKPDQGRLATRCWRSFDRVGCVPLCVPASVRLSCRPSHLCRSQAADVSFIPLLEPSSNCVTLDFVINLLADKIYVEVFCSYSHREKDMVLKEEFDAAMRPYTRKRLFQVWDDGQIGAGDEWALHIDQHLTSADIIVFLVSPDFLNSDFCCEKELPAALESRMRKKAVLVPILVRECAWKETDLAELQVLPKDAKPVTKWDDRDSAWKNVGEGLNELALGVLKEKLEILKRNEVAFDSNPVVQKTGLPPVKMAGLSDEQWAQCLSDMKQARSIYESIMRDAPKNSIDRWKIQQDMQSKIFAAIQDVTMKGAKTADKSFNNMDAYIRE